MTSRTIDSIRLNAGATPALLAAASSESARNRRAITAGVSTDQTARAATWE